MNATTGSNPTSLATQLMAIEVISELLVSTSPLKLGEALTGNLRELSGARTAMVYVLDPLAASRSLLYVSPLRRAKLFSPEELDAFCMDRVSDALSFSTEELPADHPFKAALARAGVKSMARYLLRASGELVGALLLFDLPGLDRIAETSHIVRLLSSPIALALKNSLSHSQTEQLAAVLEERVMERTVELNRKNRELQQSEARFRFAIEEAPFPVMIHAEDGEVIVLSRAWMEISGYDLTDIPTMQAWLERAYGSARQPVAEEVATFFALKQRKSEGEYRIACKDGTQRVWDFSSVPLGRLPDGRLIAMSMVSDVTERILAEERLAVSEERHRTILLTTMEGFLLLDTQRNVLDANDAYCKMSGYGKEELLGMNVLDLEALESKEQAAARIKRVQAEGRVRFESVHRRKDGNLLHVDVSVTAIPLDRGHFAAFFHDITERKLAEQQIQELAYFDGLTKLPNRRLMMDRLEHALIAYSRNRQNGGLLFVDLDDFRTLNDTYGHAEGDLLLQKVAQRLTSSVREGDTVARLGGDEFVVIIEGLSQSTVEAAEQVKMVGEKILAALGRPFVLPSREYRSTASIGAVMFKDAPESLDELLKLADIAMYQAKAAGRNNLRFFNPLVQAAVRARATMELDLRLAIERDEFRLYYQPQLSAGVVIGAEALIRWAHPTRGMVSPAEFIPLAEESDLILKVGDWVLETACARIAAWAKRPEMRSIAVAVNVSARQFRQPDFVERVLTVLACSGADPRLLKLELTESMLLENVEDVIAKMTSLKAHGLSFSLDDFGTGYSSLAYLSRLPMDQLKIDQSFVRNLATDSNSAAIAQTIVALGRTLGLSVIAEGVETQEQQGLLARMGCHTYQGYLLGRPAPVEEFERWIALGAASDT
jgi:diguanylate cyclase (GGDEF)-like protein/PAS domain S-box-containing protein